MRDQASQNVSRTAHIDRARTNLLIAIRTNTIFVGDKRPAMRAHATTIHSKPLYAVHSCSSDVTIAVPSLQGRCDRHTDDGPRQRRRHVILRIPDVALRSQPLVSETRTDDLGKP